MFTASFRRLEHLLNLQFPAEILAVGNRLWGNHRRVFPENPLLRLGVGENKLPEAVPEAVLGLGESGKEQFLLGGFFSVAFGEFQNLEPVFGDGNSDFLEKIVVETRNVFGSEAISGENEAIFVSVKWVEASS